MGLGIGTGSGVGDGAVKGIGVGPGVASSSAVGFTFGVFSFCTVRCFLEERVAERSARGERLSATGEGATAGRYPTRIGT